MISRRTMVAIIPWTALLVLWATGFCLACYLVSLDEVSIRHEQSVIEQLLGASRVALADSLYETADLYFHKGVGHKRNMSFSNSIFQVCGEAIAPTPHVHPQWLEINEIMPWLRFSTKVDPHNIDSYLVAAYWIGDQGRSPVLAEEILNEARRNNPNDHRIYAEMGRNYIIMEDAQAAGRAFDVGIGLWPSGLDAEDQEIRLQLAQMLSYRAFLCELAGDVNGAMQLFRKAMVMFPEDKALVRRMRALERGEYSREWAEEAWRGLFPRTPLCSREVHDAETCTDPSHHHEHKH